MTRAQRGFEELARAWAARPSAPPPDWLPPAPAWLADAPQLAPIRQGADVLWREGTPTWGWVLMANARLWEPGEGAAPGEILWCDDPYVERFPHALGDVSERFWQLKRNDTTAAGLRALVGFAQDEQRRFTRAPFPPLFSGGRVIWHTTMLLYREHLPCRRLVDAWLPIVRIPGGKPPIVMTLPLDYWPRELRETWQRDGAA